MEEGIKYVKKGRGEKGNDRMRGVSVALPWRSTPFPRLLSAEPRPAGRQISEFAAAPRTKKHGE